MTASFRNHGVRIADTFDFADLFFQCGIILAGGVVRLSGSLAEFLDAGFELANQPFEGLGAVVLRAVARDFLDPVGRYRFAGLHTLLDQPGKLRIAAGHDVVGDRHRFRAYLEAMSEEETADVFEELPAPALAAVVQPGVFPRLRRDLLGRFVERGGAIAEAKPAEQAAGLTR